MYNKWESYDIWFLKYRAWRTEFFMILDCFCPFTHLRTWKIKILKKWKKTLEIISFYTCVLKWQSYDVWYGSWDMEHDGHDFLSLWTIFCLFTPLTQKIKILKKWKKNLEILSFYTCVPKMTIIWYMVPEILSTMNRMFCHFGPFFALLPPNNLKNQKFAKIKKSLEILSFYTSVP